MGTWSVHERTSAPGRTASVVATWSDDTVHVWGWDGAATMPSPWLYHAFRTAPWPGSPLSAGFVSSLDLATPSGELLRPMSARLDQLQGPTWLADIDVEFPEGAGSATAPADRTRARLTDSVRWFGAAARLALRVVDAGRVTPRLTTDPRDGPPQLLDARFRTEHSGIAAVVAAIHPIVEVRWTVVDDPDHRDRLRRLDAWRPPIAVLDPDAPTAAIVAGLVDGAARARLAEARWAPDVRNDRTPLAIVGRGVFKALAGYDPRVTLTTAAHRDEAVAMSHRFGRRADRHAGVPVLERRLRLLVPDDLLDPWVIQLELVDESDPGRWCSATDVWRATPLAVEVAGHADHLTVMRAELRDAAAVAALLVPTLGELVTSDEPDAVELDVETAEDFLEQAPAGLATSGITLIGPESLVKTPIGVRGQATPAPASDRTAGLNRDTIVSWSLTVAAEDGPTAISEAELARAEAAGATLLHTGHRWIRIDPEALRRARGRLEDYTRRTNDDDLGALGLLQMAAELATAGDELGSGLSSPADGVAEPDDTAEHERRAAAWAGRLLGGLPDDELREEHEPPDFGGELRPYQRRGLSWLRFLARLGLGGCLADDMGLGKTATTLAHLLTRPGPHLVVCPLSVVHNWETEARRFAPTIPVTVHHGSQRLTGGLGDELQVAGAEGPSLVITTYGLVVRDVEHLAPVEWATVVADEAQYVKNPGTRAARSLRKLTSDQRIALTGTPVENRLSELWSILDWTNPGMLGSREKFRHRYSKPIERADDDERARQAAEALRALTRPFVLRRTKADRTLVPDLPDKIEQVAFAGLTREQAVLYQQVVDQLLADAGSHTGMKRRGLVLASITKLKQVCNHPAHALGDRSRLRGRSGKLARFDELLDGIVDVGERALVFTQYVDMGLLLQRHLAEQRGWSAPFLQGSLGKSRRDRMVTEFQDGVGPPVLLVSLKAGGTGLNLTAASQVIHYDRWWNPAVENQATDRAWRIGQQRGVVVHKLVCEGTIEERIAAVIDDKAALADVVVGHGEAWLSELTTGQLQDLVRLDLTAPVGRGHTDDAEPWAGEPMS